MRSESAKPQGLTKLSRSIVFQCQTEAPFVSLHIFAYLCISLHSEPENSATCESEIPEISPQALHPIAPSIGSKYPLPQPEVTRLARSRDHMLKSDVTFCALSALCALHCGFPSAVFVLLMLLCVAKLLSVSQSQP